MKTFDEDIVFYEPISVLGGINHVTDSSKGGTTVDVHRREHITFLNTGAITVTVLSGGSEGQIVTFLGDGQTTMKNNTLIKTNTGADKLLASLKIYPFRFINGVWYEFA